MAAKNITIGKRGTYLSLVSILFFAVCSALIGLYARAALGVHDMAIGIFAIPDFLLTKTGNHPLWEAIAVLSIWAAALTWTAPLMFSGASSLGNDILKHCFNKAKHRDDSLVKFCVQVFFPLQALMIVVYGLAKPEQLAWWQVFGLTVRNGAVFAPTIVLLFWSIGEKKAAVASMIAGILLGIGWNWLGGFSATSFYLGMNPMWVSSSVSLFMFIVLSPLIQWKNIHFVNGSLTYLFVSGSIVLYALAIWLYLSAPTRVFSGLSLLLATVLLSIYAFRAIHLNAKKDDALPLESGHV